MRTLIIPVILFYMALSTLSAQQVPQWSQYYAYPLVFNPAFAGLVPHPTVTVGYRQQWLGVPDAPVSQVLNVQLPLRDKRVGFGFSFANDQAGPLATSDLQAAYSYALPISADWQLRGGLQAGTTNWRSNWNDLSIEDQDDPAFQFNLNRWLPNFGAGIVLSDANWQFGFGCPQLLTYDLRRAKDDGATIYARTFRHYYWSASRSIGLKNNTFYLRPMLLIRSADWFRRVQPAPFDATQAPDAFDLGVQAWWLQKFGLGLNYRSAFARSKSSDDVLALSAQWQIPRTTLHIGLAYDILLSPLQQVSGGSMEILVRYSFVKTAAPLPVPIQSETSPVPPVEPSIVSPKPVILPANDMPADAVVPYIVQGIVFDTEGLPAENARVTTTNTCGQADHRAYITGSDGRYKFNLKPGCCYTLKVEKDGYREGLSDKICPQAAPKGVILRADLDLKK